MKKKFGELLLERRLITPEQLSDALSLQRRRGMRLGAALVARGHLTEAQLVDALGSALGLKVVDLSSVPVSSEALALVNLRFAQDHDLFPYALRKERGRKVLSIAMSDPLNFPVIDQLGFMTNAQIETVLAKPSDIDAAITRHYGMRFRASDAYGRDANGADLLALETAEDERTATTMTILRKGGGEEVVETQTGKVISPFIKGPDGQLLDNPEVNLPPSKGTASEEISAVLLTEEVAESTPLDAVQKVAVAPKSSAQPGMVTTGRMPVPNLAQGLSQPLPPQQAQPQQFRTQTGSLVSPPPPEAAFRTKTGSMPVQQPPQDFRTQTGSMQVPPQPQQDFRTKTGSMPVQQQPQDFRTKTGSMPVMPPPRAPITGPITSPMAQPIPSQLPTTPPMAAQAMPGQPMPPQVPMQPMQTMPPPFSPPAPQAPGSPYFDDALGALLDAAGGAVNAEAFFRLERRFWALMRLLAKKGIISNEEFMKELGENEDE